MKKIFVAAFQWVVLTFLFSMIVPAFVGIIWCITFAGFDIMKAFHDPNLMAIEGFFAFMSMIGAAIYVDQEL